MWKLIIAVVLLQGFGMVWYSIVFGRLWGKISGQKARKDMTAEENKVWFRGNILTRLLSALTTVLVVFTFAFLSKTPLLLMPFALIIFIGLIIPVIANYALNSGLPKNLALKMFLIDFGFWLISFVFIVFLFAI